MVELLSLLVVAAVLGWSGWMLRGQNRALGHALLQHEKDARAERELLLGLIERVSTASNGRETAAIESVLDRLGYGAGSPDEAESVKHVSEDDEINEAKQRLISEVDAELEAMAAQLDGSPT